MKIRLGNALFDFEALDEDAGYCVPDWVLTRPDLTALESWWLSRVYGVSDLVYDPSQPDAGTAFRSPGDLLHAIVGLPYRHRLEAEQRLIRRGVLRIVPPEDIAPGELRTEDGFFDDSPAYLIFPRGAL